MNCLEFHRQKLADPRRLSAEAQAHAQACASCAAFARSVDESDQRLEEALASPVPNGLADRIILRSRTKNRAWRAWTLAASVVLAVAVGLSFVREPKNAADQYARLAVEHVMMEPESLTTVRNADPPAPPPLPPRARASSAPSRSASTGTGGNDPDGTQSEPFAAP